MFSRLFLYTRQYTEVGRHCRHLTFQEDLQDDQSILFVSVRANILTEYQKLGHVHILRS